MHSKRPKILFVAEGITMTHFTRPAVLAEALDPAEWEVHFRAPRRYHALLSQGFAGLDDLPTRDPRQFLESLATGALLYPADTLEQYVHTDLAILDEVRPDVVVGDYRLSLCVSAPLRSIPFVSIFNAHWSPGHRQPAIVPQLPVTRWVSPRLLNPIYACLRPWIYARHSRPIDHVRRKFGLPSIKGDIRQVYTAGDLVLYPDLPDLVPVAPLPPHHHFIGPCAWEPPVPKPAWWRAALASPQPRVFVSLGSSGPLAVLPAVLAALEALPLTLIVATSGRPISHLPSSAYVADLLPYGDTAKQCALVISHGGTGGLYPALSSGAPMLAIPSNVDQHLSAARLQASGAGLVLRAEYASTERIRAAVARLLAERHFSERAAAFAASIGQYDSRQLFPSLMRSWIGGRGEEHSRLPSQ